MADYRGGVTIYALDAQGNKCVLSVKALEEGLPECDTYYWYWDDNLEKPGKDKRFNGKMVIEYEYCE